jgi:hypothetical protein
MNPESYKLVVDMPDNMLPIWWTDDRAGEVENELRRRISGMIVVLDKPILLGGKWIVGGSAKIGRVVSASIERVCGSARIESVRDSARIGGVYDSARIGSVYGSARIGGVYDSASIGVVCGSASIESVCDSARIESVRDSASIESVRDSARIEKDERTKTEEPK